MTAARAKHQPVHSLHEGYAHLLEELDELKDQVWKWPDHDPARVVRELTQIAAYCQRMVEDLRLTGGVAAFTESGGGDDDEESSETTSESSTKQRGIA